MNFDLKFSKPHIAYSMHPVMGNTQFLKQEEPGLLLCGLHCKQQLEPSYCFQDKKGLLGFEVSPSVKAAGFKVIA